MMIGLSCVMTTMPVWSRHGIADVDEVDAPRARRPASGSSQVERHGVVDRRLVGRTSASS
jgi:hypothetical protein